jgi:hypothetical protein
MNIVETSHKYDILSTEILKVRYFHHCMTNKTARASVAATVGLLLFGSDIGQVIGCSG